jgi:GNAT superfamily N-acetyltransferase
MTLDAMNKPTRIRPAEARDVIVLTRLAGELGYPSSEAQMAVRLERVLKDSDHAVFVAENESGSVVGWVHIFTNKLLESDARAEIGGLISDPNARRQGIGRALMRGAEEWARERGLPLISLRSNIKRTDAHRFYEGLGYAAAKTQFNFRKQL